MKMRASFSPGTIHPFLPRLPSAVAVEVQVFDSLHCLCEMPPHGHTFFEVIVVTKGAGEHMVNGEVMLAKCGDVFVIRPGDIHDCRAMRATVGWVVLFLPDGVLREAPARSRGLGNHVGGALFDAFHHPSKSVIAPVELDAVSLGVVESFVERMHAELVGRRLGYEHAVRGLLQLLLIELSRATHRAGQSDPVSTAHPRRSNQVDRIFDDIDSHFRGRSALQDASRRLGITGAYLTTLLKRETNRTYGAWVVERRMLEARHLLSSTTKGISEVADEVGYAEVESFIRRFRISHRMTPSAWRKQAQ